MSDGLLLALDPGTRGVGVALFDRPSKRLLRACYVKSPMGGGRRADAALATAQAVARWADADARAVCHVAVEVPRVYDTDHQKGDQNDLIDLTLVSGAAAGYFGSDATRVLSYFPQEWKGTIDAETCLARIIKRLSPAEQKAVTLVGRFALTDVPGHDTLDHNTVDAIGIGLFFLGRFAPERVFARE